MIFLVDSILLEKASTFYFSCQIKTVGKLRMQGASRDYVSAFRLFYSDDGKNWKGYSTDDDVDKVIYYYCISHYYHMQCICIINAFITALNRSDFWC